MDNDTVRKALPPYVSYRTFRNFIDELQMGIPARIDRSYWGERYSGSTGTQLMTALRFLGLINGGGVPTTRLRQLVSAAGAQRPEVLKQIARTAFDFLSEKSLDPVKRTTKARRARRKHSKHALRVLRVSVVDFAPKTKHTPGYP